MGVQDRRARYLQAIGEHSPKLRIEAARLAHGGQNNDVLMVNGEYLFRFPRYPAGIGELRREAVVLSAIQDLVPLRVPKPVFANLETDEVGKAFLGHRVVPGEPLWPGELSSVSGACAKATGVLDRFAEQLGAFLRALHRVPVRPELARLLPMADTPKSYELFYARVREDLFPLMRADARKWTERHFESYLGRTGAFDFRRVLKHGDFGPSNILFHRGLGNVTGVIDFAAAALGDPAYDFAGLAGGYGEAFVMRCAPVYPEVAEMLPRIRFYRDTFALEEALFGLENDDEVAFRRGIQGFA